MNLSAHLEEPDNPLTAAVFFTSDLPMPTTPPPFQPGELVRPRCPAHPWRQYCIVVDTCSLISQIWLITVYIHTPTALHTKVLAEDYERVNPCHSRSSGHIQRANCG